jgi:hypothetical protein
VFPNKACLQLKIREVRQKLMSTNQDQGGQLSANQSPLTPSAANDSTIGFDLPLTPATPVDTEPTSSSSNSYAACSTTTSAPQES